ncbi:MAG TPA: FxLYD domain-containing protein [Spirochaetota bacterium]|nr:FxLYD domain-containing protein [Spirochaetota bacterium]
MRCDNCSSGDFEKLSGHEYRCRYCGSLKIVEALAPRSGAQTPPAGGEVMSKREIRIALAVVGILLFLSGIVSFFLLRPGPPPPRVSSITGTANVKPSPAANFGADSIEKVHPPHGDFHGVAALPDMIGNVYVVGLYRNTGRSIIRKPMVVATLYSGDGRKVAMGKGYAIREVLLPGEETPVRVLVSRPPAWTRYEISHVAEHPHAFTRLGRPAMELRACRLQKGRYSGYEVTGEIVNRSGGPVKFVQVAGVVYDASKNVIGAGAGYAGGNLIAPGDYTTFSVRISPLKGEPESFTLDYEAREAR